MNKFVLVEGNPVDGFTYTGPFNSSEEAVEYADDGVCTTADWWVAEMEFPS